jgi:hypothetical protein
MKRSLEQWWNGNERGNRSFWKETRFCHFVKQPELYIKIQSVPRSKTTLFSVTNTDQLMVYREIKAVCSEIHVQHINAVQKVEFLDVEAGDTYSYHLKKFKITVM